MATTNTIVEIKKGQTGRGLLIENDGYIDFTGNMINEAIGEIGQQGRLTLENLPDPFILPTVFQKFGIENANGRIYPEHILKREVAKYQRLIDEKRAYGECYTEEALILTAKDGWKSIKNVKEGEEILTLNPDTQEIEILPVIRKIERQHSGKMIRINGRGINDLVTPGHKFPIFGDFGFTDFRSAQDMLEENCSGGWIPIDLSGFTSSSKSDINDMSFDCEDYDGTVYCVDVERNHTWYVMSNGFCHWTGNCNHPDSSVIDLGRIALNIIELHWEAHTLVGKVEIPVTYGFRKYGIVSTYADHIAQLILSGLKVGVSSRGLGSVTKMPNGKLMVGDDYEIVCWDAVSTPSTPNAWISKSEEETKMYVESKEEKKDKPTVNEDKYSKFDKWLLI